MKDSLSAPDLASLLGITERTLRRWEEGGTGPKRVVENGTRLSARKPRSMA